MTINKDMAGTTIGTGLGLENWYEALDHLITQGPDWAVLGLFLKGLLTISLGYFAWKGDRTSVSAPTPTT